MVHMLKMSASAISLVVVNITTTESVVHVVALQLSSASFLDSSLLAGIPQHDLLIIMTTMAVRCSQSRTRQRINDFSPLSIIISQSA